MIVGATSRNVHAEAKVWRAVRAAARLADGMTMRSRGLYEVSPELTLAFKQAVDAARPLLAQHDRELEEGGRS